MSRVVKKYIPFFAKFAKTIEKHIPHEFSNEMAQKAEVISDCLCEMVHVHTYL